MSSQVRTKPYADPELSAPPPRASRLSWLLGGVLVAAAGAAAVVVLGTDPVDDGEVAPAADVPSTVELTIDSDPAGAAVHIDGRARGTTPLVLSVDRADEPMVVRLEREGHTPVEESVTPDVSQRLRLSLPVVVAAPAEERGAQEQVRPSRARRPSRQEPASEDVAETPPTMESSDERERAFRRFN